MSKRHSSRLNAISLVLAVMMVFIAVFNLAVVDTSASNTSDTIQAPAAVAADSRDGLKMVPTSSVNFDSVREQYLNYSLVEKNIASYDGERWAIISLPGEPLYDKFERSGYSDFQTYYTSKGGQQALASIVAEQQEFLRKLDNRKLDYQFKYSYSVMNNGLALKINAQAFNAIKTISGVSDVYYSESYAMPKDAVTNDTNVYTTGIYNSKNISYKGEGMTVAILDTGLDKTHEAFQAMPDEQMKSDGNGGYELDTEKNEQIRNLPGFFDYDYVDSVVKSGGLRAVCDTSDVYYNSKVPFAYDYADDDPNVYPSYSSHGTHVAGIVAGSSDYVVNQAQMDKGEATDPEYFIGVAPLAQLVICKVFTDDLDRKGLGGADTIDILAALNDCVVLGVDVINMSLGTTAGFADEKSDEAINSVYNRIKAAGISLIVAASNDYSSGFGGGNGTNLAINPDSGTVGSPSTYAAAISVASINGRKASYIYANDDKEGQVAFITNASNEYGIEYKFSEQMYAIAAKNRNVESIPFGTDLHFKYVVIGGVGDSYSISNKNQLKNRGDYDGTIALVKRGDITFLEKVKNAMDAGADACIIYNNVSGTIRMSLGDLDNPIPTCSITMEAGKVLVDNAKRGIGTITVNSDLQAGPFMSEFSSWGPTPDLQLKPEISAHGGEIISAVAGGYDKYSGTSMAAPNMAGAVALLRQHLKENQSYYGISGSDAAELNRNLTARVNQVLMSTATIAMNEVGNPYSPRKQGAGLAGIENAIKAESYLTVNDAQGNERDRTKIELFDDPMRIGEYKLDFFVNNLTSTAQTYTPNLYVMTETIASDNKTVAEMAYMLNDMCTIEYKIGADHSHLEAAGSTVTIPANSKVAMSIRIVLGKQARKYIDTNFTNGMYVEGFVSLEAAGNTKITLGLPYLAFYGDWTDGDMFDYDTYELAESEKDKNVPAESKLKASAAETRVIGLYYEDNYILPMGSYVYTQDEENDVPIYPEREKIAVSMYDDKSGHTIYQLYAVYAGLLRSAAYVNMTITDAVTGELVYFKRDENVGKSYAAGGSNRGAGMMFELNPNEWNMANNRIYNVSISTELDYPEVNPQDPKYASYFAAMSADEFEAYKAKKDARRKTFDFQFAVDYEAPRITDYRVRYLSYTENKVVKYKIFMDVDVYDNQFVQAVMPCYIEEREGEDVLQLLTSYPIPAYGQRGEVTTVSFEVTDFYDKFVKEGLMYLQVEDYAMNAATYQVVFSPDNILGADAKDYPEKVEFVPDEHLTRSMVPSQDMYGHEYYQYNLEITPHTLYTLNTILTPADKFIQTLTWEGTSSRVKANANEIYSSGTSGRGTLYLVDDLGGIYAQVICQIKGEVPAENPRVATIKLGSQINSSNSISSLDNDNPSIKLNPGQKFTLDWTVTPWYCDKPNGTWSNDLENPDIVSIDADGNLVALKKGTCFVTLKLEGVSLSKTVCVEVGDGFDVRNFTLYKSFGSGEVEIPSDRNIIYLDEDCFKYNLDITKVILPDTLTEVPKEAFLGCVNLREIVIPGQCITIKERAFEGCTSLEKITLGTFVDSEHNQLGNKFPDKYFGVIALGRMAFKGCVNLKEITNQGRITTLYSNAFEGCTGLESIDLSQLRVTGNSVFKGCTGLSDITVSENTALGSNMFEGCTGLESFAFKGVKVPVNAFKDCTSLASVSFAEGLREISYGAFSGAALTEISLPSGEITISANAFENCAELERVALSADTVLVQTGSTPFVGCDKFTAYAIDGSSANYKVLNGMLVNPAQNTLYAVPYGLDNISLAGISILANGALAGANLESVNLTGMAIGNYALAGSKIKSAILPFGMTNIPEGLFDGCALLENVSTADNFVNVTRIGNNAFRGCVKLESLTMANIATVGNSAFERCGISVQPSNKISKVGNKAFKESKLATVDLPLLTSIGYEAFADILTLTSVNVGAVTEMGGYAFVGSTSIKNATFATGTTLIGDFAFYVEPQNDEPMLLADDEDEEEEDEDIEPITISIPNTVEIIGTAAFSGLVGLTEIGDLSGVKTVMPYAFASCVNLATANLENIEIIAPYAFASTALESVNLKKATVIGGYAFYATDTLEELSMSAAEVIGEYAFAYTGLEKVVIPASMNSRTYELDWDMFDEKNRVKETKTRNEDAYGNGAFANIYTLTEFEVEEGNDAYFTVDGVLYSRTPNGYVLEQYPTVKEDEEYTVIDGTVEINRSAFESVYYLEKVTMPYTVKLIGSYAFFNSMVAKYVFNSVEAPVLEAEYISPEYINETLDPGDDPIMQYVKEVLMEIYTRGETSFACTNFYTNFVTYAVFGDESMFVQDDPGEEDEYSMAITIPKNAVGYSDGAWSMFFSFINYTDEIAADDNTHRVVELVGKLPEPSEIANMPYSQISATSEIGKLAASARAAYNKVTDDEQKAFVEEAYAKLLEVESAIRDRKAALNHPVSVKELIEQKSPDKIAYYVGETFDPTGMIIIAVYEDGSEVLLSGNNFSVSPRVIGEGVNQVTITYTDAGGKRVSTTIYLNINHDTPPAEPTDPSGDDNNDSEGLSLGAKVAIGVVVPVVVIAAVVVAVVLVLASKKKKSTGSAPDNNGGDSVENLDVNEDVIDNEVRNALDETESESASAEETENEPVSADETVENEPASDESAEENTEAVENPDEDNAETKENSDGVETSDNCEETTSNEPEETSSESVEESSSEPVEEPENEPAETTEEPVETSDEGVGEPESVEEPENEESAELQSSDAQEEEKSEPQAEENAPQESAQTEDAPKEENVSNEQPQEESKESENSDESNN